MLKLKNILLILICAITIFANTATADAKPVTKQVEVLTKDNRFIKAKITYEKIAGLEKYSTVILLHSIGYDSSYWLNLVPELNAAGYAVIAVDLRGHGQSVYSSTFHKKSWTYFTNDDYAKMPNDVMDILAQVQKSNKNINLNATAIVGADIGANIAVMVADKMKVKPKTLVLISPTRKFKGLYIPITLTNITMPILSMASQQDRYCLKEQKELAKFSQGGFYAQNYPNGGMGMLMIKVNAGMTQDIVKWVMKYLKPIY
ncbi:MAG: alpha/beta hydrolase [bacterium]|nr:alpha/beta hydrolase [bacterium]